MNVLILGYGLLGKEIYKQTNWDVLCRSMTNLMDFSDIDTYKSSLDSYDTIVNCIANTDTYSEDRQKHWDVNYSGVVQLVDYCLENKKKLIHVSTDYVYSGSEPNASENSVPVHGKNWYGYTKLISDAYVQLKLKNYLLIRTSFRPYPFPYKFALINQIGNFDRVDVISKIMIKLINNNSIGVFNVGTKLKNMCDLAPHLERINKVIHENMPYDVSMNLQKLDNEFIK
jgi:dTDP-4-dehydrorhamnose reductase